MTIDDSLDWDSHIEKIMKKVSSGTKRVRHLVPKATFTCLWKNLARQHEIEKATLVYKSLHGLASEYLCSRFAIRETAYNLRD